MTTVHHKAAAAPDPLPPSSPSLIGQDNTTAIFDNPTNTAFWISNDKLTFLGNADALNVSRANTTSIAVGGTNQSLYIGESNTGITVTDSGNGLQMEFYWTVATIDLGKDLTKSAVHLIGPNDVATQTTDGHGGTLLNVSGFGCATVDFLHVAPGHVNVVPA